jgi:hypothetical protein
MTKSNHEWFDPARPEREKIGDHQQFIELCALATAGPLNENEASQLQAHLEECPECSEALAEFRFVAVDGASLLVPAEVEGGEVASVETSRCGPSVETHSWSQANAKRDLFARIAEEAGVGGRVPRSLVTLGWKQKLQYSVALIILLGTLAFGAYRLGVGHVERRATTGNHADAQAQLLSERSVLEQQLKSRDVSIEDLTRKLDERSATIEVLRRELTDAEAKGRTQADELNTFLAKSAASANERDSLLRKLQDAETSMVSLQGELDSLRAERRNNLLRASTLETQIEQLKGRLAESQQTVAQQQDFLVSDRDIRELMGARNLYITDVVDVDKNGHTQKPFGRIFYTRGKSLIFYAFDLDQRRGLHNAAFQLWGQQGSDRSSYVNMGIFYLDNEANRRWVLKFDDPGKLAQINALFVTVEPHGGSQKPGGKQLLYASLRTLPNHP